MEEMPQFPPEYVNESNTGGIAGVVGAFHSLALTFVSLRLYVRLFMVRAFGVDDVLIILAAGKRCIRMPPWLSTLRISDTAHLRSTSLLPSDRHCRRYYT